MKVVIERIERFHQPNDVRDMIGCDSADSGTPAALRFAGSEMCGENSKVKVRFKSTRVRYYCRACAEADSGTPAATDTGTPGMLRSARVVRFAGSTVTGVSAMEMP